MLKIVNFEGSYKELEDKLHTRKQEVTDEVNKSVTEIVNNIRNKGDEALFNYCLKFDG